MSDKPKLTARERADAEIIWFECFHTPHPKDVRLIEQARNAIRKAFEQADKVPDLQEALEQYIGERDVLGKAVSELQRYKAAFEWLTQHQNMLATVQSSRTGRWTVMRLMGGTREYNGEYESPVEAIEAAREAEGK